MHEDALPENVPSWLRKDMLSTREEVPVEGGGSKSVRENYYTPRVYRWALEEWLAVVPADADAAALRRALPAVLADTPTFHAYLRVPEAFGEVYREELAKQSERRCELTRVKRGLERGPFSDRPRPFGRLYIGLLVAYGIVLLMFAL